MPLIATRGASSVQGFGQFAQASGPVYVEDVFSTYLIDLLAGAGNQQIPHGLDFSTYGGLTWVKSRTTAYGHTLGTTSIGTSKMLFTNTTDAVTSASSFVSFDTNGTTITRAGGYFGNSNNPVVSWNFRKQPKFFDIVTYTGTAGSTKTISHNLGSVPGVMIVKSTTRSGDRWFFWHRSIPTQRLILNTTGTQDSGASVFGDGTNVIQPTSTQFTVANNSEINDTGQTYVAYLFAHDAGGFGLTGLDNVISCGSYTGNGSVTGPSVTLGYEPQWVLVKSSTVAGSLWYLMDNVRGMAHTQCKELYANSSVEEVLQSKTIIPTATGFNVATNDAYINNNGSTYIYIAIRRGPMKVPTTGTSVYQGNAYTGNATVNTTVAGNFGFPVDLMLLSSRSANSTGWSTYAQFVFDRLRGQDRTVGTAKTTAETTGWQTYHDFGVSNSIGWGLYGAASDSSYMNNSGGTWVANGLKRAPSFFDIVCYTGTGSATTFSHNLAAVPELIIYKCRSNATTDWTTAFNFTNTTWDLLFLNYSDASYGTYSYDNTVFYSAKPTSTLLSFGNSTNANAPNVSGRTYVAYLFATCAGVSKVFSYTGNGSSQTINCGFTGGARFVMIKRTDSSGDWYVWDTARGIVSGNDPHLSLNTTSAEVTSNDTIDTDSTGFVVNQVSATNVNVSSATYIGLAIA